MNEHVVEILNDLERIRENVLTFSNKIWESIDHNNQEALKKGCEFKHAYNEKMIEFDRISEEISKLIKQYTKVNLDKPVDDAKISVSQNDTIISELNKKTPSPLYGEFKGTKPCAFVIDGQAYKDLYTWKDFIVNVCNVLKSKNTALFDTLTDRGKHRFFSNRLFFSTSETGLKYPKKVCDNVFVETNLSADHSVKLIRYLIKIFGISDDKFKIYLRES